LPLHGLLGETKGMLSAFLQITGWCCIAMGTLATFTKIRTLRRLIRLGKSEVIDPELRQQAWLNAWSGPLTLTWGVFAVSHRWLHGTLIWLPATYSVIFMIWIAGSWFWLHNKVNSV
jgi:hypothetical protein